MITTTLHVNFHLNVGYNLPWAQVPVLYFRPQIIKDRYIHIYIYVHTHTPIHVSYIYTDYYIAVLISHHILPKGHCTFTGDKLPGLPVYCTS